LADAFALKMIETASAVRWSAEAYSADVITVIFYNAADWLG